VKEEIINKLKKHILFKNIEPGVLSEFVSNDGVLNQSFKSGEEIYSPKHKEKRLGFILSGEANVYSSDENRSVLLRKLEEGDTFGVANLFDEDTEFVSLIVAKRNSQVLFFTASAVEKLLNENTAFRMGYIKFLSQRICFLNKKISCFTAGSPERRLAVFLYTQCKNGKNTFTVNANALSEMLNVGRASLYRAFEKLISDGLIQKNGKSITVLDMYGIETNYID